MKSSSKTLSFARRVWALTRPYWKSEERWMARLLLVAVIGLNLGNVYLDVLFNEWNNDFYNSLQNFDMEGFKHAMIRFTYLAAFSIAVGVYGIYLAQMLRIKWRRWMTERYLGHWLAQQNYYRMQMFGSQMDNPDQRISQDIDQFIQMTLDLSIGSLSSIVRLFSFLGILWVLSGALDFVVHGMAFHIPGYMLWIVLIYAAAGTWLTFRIGWPLIGLNYEQQRYEADFRYSMIRMRENSESVAFYEGETQEKQWFLERFSHIVGNWWLIMRRQKKLGWFTSGYGQIAVIFPYLVAAPRYFSKAIPLGGLMQTASAFLHVQGSLSYLINAFSVDSVTGIANWKAVADRLNGFNESIAKAEASQALKPGLHAEADSLTARGITLSLPDGRLLLQNINISIKPGDSLLITGISGTGKSTLLRALAGLWPFAEGELSLPRRRRMFFVPQKPYLPLGTLAQALCYPRAPDVSETRLKEILLLCGLPLLMGKLDDTQQWSNVLSLGEQQRVAFARILLAKPDFVFLDEATSALDEAAEAHLYGLLASRLPDTALVSVGHRASLRAWHASEMVLAA